ncbi:MAG: ATP-binding cassette domain-containing protein [Acidobacteriota bacterium]
MELSSQTLALTTSSLAYSYGAGGETTLTFPDITIARGESCAVVGPSGCGKTTLLHLIAGLLTPQAGSIHVAGQRMDTRSQRDRDRLRGRRIGIVLQQLRLISSLSALDNLLLAQRLAGQPVDREAATEQLAGLGLGQLLHRRPRALSQGEAQRVAIARALMGQPKLLLADEPTSSLDDANAERVLQLLMEQAAEHDAALLVVTHDARIRGWLDQEIELARTAA